jgi:hypothetical protein
LGVAIAIGRGASASATSYTGGHNLAVAIGNSAFASAKGVSGNHAIAIGNPLSDVPTSADAGGPPETGTGNIARVLGFKRSADAEGVGQTSTSIGRNVHHTAP